MPARKRSKKGKKPKSWKSGQGKPGAVADGMTHDGGMGGSGLDLAIEGQSVAATGHGVDTGTGASSSPDWGVDIAGCLPWKRVQQEVHRTSVLAADVAGVPMKYAGCVKAFMATHEGKGEAEAMPGKGSERRSEECGGKSETMTDEDVMCLKRAVVALLGTPVTVQCKNGRVIVGVLTCIDRTGALSLTGAFELIATCRTHGREGVEQVLSDRPSHVVDSLRRVCKTSDMARKPEHADAADKCVHSTLNDDAQSEIAGPLACSTQHDLARDKGANIVPCALNDHDASGLPINIHTYDHLTSLGASVDVVGVDRKSVCIAAEGVGRVFVASDVVDDHVHVDSFKKSFSLLQVQDA